jgi:K+:H+ antiporter
VSWRVGVYGLMILGAVGAVALICRRGETLVAPPAAAAPVATAAASRGDVLVHVLLALAAVILTGLVLARLFAYLGQPPVIGEVVAGIVLGPSLLGPTLSARILPPEVAPFLGIIAEIGIILYMFTVGLELHGDLLRRRVRETLATSHASILVPFVLGTLLALGLYPRLSSRDVPFTSFALFLGVAMSITAFPVLARILEDRGMMATDLGALALSCAATGDVTAWCLLAFVVGVARARLGEGLLVVAGAILFIGLMIVVARPILRRAVARWDTGAPAPAAVALAFVALLLSAIATEAIGIHAIFGAFLLGAILPRDGALARAFTQQLKPLVTALLLPAFFAFAGMRTRIDLVSGAEQWLLCGLIVLVATAGKFGGTVAAARVTGLDWRSSAALGALMNTRGLMELIVLNVGLDLQVITPTLFAMMVLMALVTTMATAPALRLLVPDIARAPAPARAAGA